MVGDKDYVLLPHSQRGSDPRRGGTSEGAAFGLDRAAEGGKADNAKPLHGIEDGVTCGLQRRRQ
jgi:hypothetical protein